MTERIEGIGEPRKRLNLTAVLSKYYPNIDFGHVKDPLTNLIGTITGLGIKISPDTVSAHRAGSNRYDLYTEEYLARSLLLKALLNDRNWRTSTVINTTSSLVDLAGELMRKPDGYYTNTWGLRKSSGLSFTLAEQFKVNPQIITRLFRGIRIDGAYIAQDFSEANKQLLLAVETYVTDYLRQPPSIQKNPETIERLTEAKNAKQIYSIVYGTREENVSHRRIGAMVPYELDYWNWLIKSKTIFEYRHMPFSQRIIEAYSQGYEVHEDLRKKVFDETGILTDEQVNGARYHLIQRDIPPEYFKGK